jgi:hypothetical protein
MGLSYRHHMAYGRTWARVGVLAALTMSGVLGACDARDQVGAAPVAAPEHPDCGHFMPIRLDVPAAVAHQKAPAPDTPPTMQQLVETWRTPLFVLEARWPPDSRELQAPAGIDHELPLLAGWGSNDVDHLDVDVADPADTVGNVVTSTDDFTVLVDPHFVATKLPEPCRLLQLRVTMRDGQRQTFGVGLERKALGLDVVDLGPLVDSHEQSTRRILTGWTSLCLGEHSVTANAVTGAPLAATPAEALRTFLVTSLADQVPAPTSPRPFDELTLPDGNVRYEHFVEWRAFAVVDVTQTADGWTVDSWWTGSC